MYDGDSLWSEDEQESRVYSSPEARLLEEKRQRYLVAKRKNNEQFRAKCEDKLHRRTNLPASFAQKFALLDYIDLGKLLHSMEEGDIIEKTAIGSSGIFITAGEPRSKRIASERDWLAAIRHWSDGVFAFYKERKSEIESYIDWIQARARAGNWPDSQIIRFDEKVRKDHAARRITLLSDTSSLYAHQADLLSATQSQPRASGSSGPGIQHSFRSIADPADARINICKAFNARSCKSPACPERHICSICQDTARPHNALRCNLTTGANRGRISAGRRGGPDQHLRLQDN